MGVSQRKELLVRGSFHLLVGAMLLLLTTVIGNYVYASLSGESSWVYRGGLFVGGLILAGSYLLWQFRTIPESADQTDKRIRDFASNLRRQVRGLSYGARRSLIEAPLKKLELDITPLVGDVRYPVRDHSLREHEPISEETTNIVAAFKSAGRGLLILGEPGSGKTMAAYRLIEHLDESEADERMPLLVNLSAWGEQDDFEAFLVDYLCSQVGYQQSRQRAVAREFVSSRRYSLVLDGLDEVPAKLREGLCERLDEFVRDLEPDVAVVVTCRSQQYEELARQYPEGLGVVQAVEVRPLTSEQLDTALVELVRRDQGWEELRCQRERADRRRVRDLLSNPLFLNLAVGGHLCPRQLLRCNEDQALRNLVVDEYLKRKLDDQKQYESEDARRYLAWMARFLNGAEVSPFDCKTSDSTVFDIADLTPPSAPGRYRLLLALVVGLGFGLVVGLVGGLGSGLVVGLGSGLVGGLSLGLIGALLNSALRNRLKSLTGGPTASP